MATEAETLLSGSSWLPEPLRTPGRTVAASAEIVETETASVVEPAVVQTAAECGEPAMEDRDAQAEDEIAAPEPHAIAAE